MFEYSGSVGITKHSTSSFSTGPAVKAISQVPISSFNSNYGNWDDLSPV